MRRRNEGPAGMQPDPQETERTSSTGSGSFAQSSTGATSTGSQDTGGPYQQGSQMTTGSRGTAPAPQGGYGTSGSGGSGYYTRAPVSRHGGGLAILAGSLAFLQGLAYVIRSSFYHFTTAGYAYSWSLHGWGWVLLILGALLFAGGVSVLLGLKGSREVAGGIAVILAVIAFITIFYSVIWGIVVLAASGFAASSLLMHREDYSVGGGGQSYQSGYQQDQAMAGQGQGSRHRM